MNGDSGWAPPDRVEPGQQPAPPGGSPAAPVTGPPFGTAGPPFGTTAPMGPPFGSTVPVGAPFGASAMGGQQAPPQRITLPPHLRPVPPGGPPAPGHLARTPSGLFPSGPPRPTYQEPGAVTGGAVAAGVGAAGLWMLLFGLLAHTAREYAWYTVAAGIAAWAAAFVLTRFGDRGVATGVACMAAVGVAIAGMVTFADALNGHWLLW